MPKTSSLPIDIPSLLQSGFTEETARQLYAQGEGLLVKSAVDTRVYPKGIEVTDDELAKVKLKPYDFHGEWNYTENG